MSETSEDDFQLIRESLDNDDSSSGAVDPGNVIPDAEAHVAHTEPLIVSPGDSEQATEQQRKRRRGGSVSAIIAAALIVSLMSFALLRLAPLAAGSHQHNAFAADASATLTPTSTATATATATVAPTATAAPTATQNPNYSSSSYQPLGTAQDNFTVQSAVGSVTAATDGFPGMTANYSGSAASFTGGCGTRIFVTMNYTMTLSAAPQGGMTIDYYIRHSDGSSEGTASQPIQTGWGSPATSNLFTNQAQWIFPYTQATGAPQWIELDVVSPNPVTERVNFTANCQWALGAPQVSTSATRYDCTVGGVQNFTVNGTLTASLSSDTNPHTVTYYWQHADGSSTPTQTFTIPGGATSVPIPSDTAPFMHQAGTPQQDNAYVLDYLFVKDASGVTWSNYASIRASC